MLFMQHGIMVGVWMACSSLVGFWLWRAKLFKSLFGISAVWWVGLMFVTTVYCKVGSGMVSLLLGLATFFGCRLGLPSISLILLALIPITYLGTRATKIWEGDSIAILLESIDKERSGSLAARMRQEGLYVDNAFRSPVFGFGGGDFIPKDASGNKLVRGNDGFWIITLGMYGFVSLVCGFAALTLPAIMVALRATRVPKLELNALIPLAVIVVLFAIDCLANAMINPIYLLCAGAVSTVVHASQNNRTDSESHIGLRSIEFENENSVLVSC